MNPYPEPAASRFFHVGYIKELKYYTLTHQSDRNLKENIAESSLGLDFIKSLKPVQFNWKTDGEGEKLKYGFIAQDFEELVNSGVNWSGWDDGIVTNQNSNWEEDGEPETYPTSQSIDESQLISPLTKAIQELSAQVEALSTRVATLEG